MKDGREIYYAIRSDSSEYPTVFNIDGSLINEYNDVYQPLANEAKQLISSLSTEAYVAQEQAQHG